MSNPISRVLSTLSKVRDDILRGNTKPEIDEMDIKLAMNRMHTKILAGGINMENVYTPGLKTRLEDDMKKKSKVDNILLDTSDEEKQEIYDKLNKVTRHKNVAFKKTKDMTVDEFYKYQGIQRFVYEQINNERERQMDMWGHQKHDNFTWMAILMEEVGEAFQALNGELFSGKESDPDNFKEELVQSAAVIVAILEQMETSED